MGEGASESRGFRLLDADQASEVAAHDPLLVLDRQLGDVVRERQWVAQPLRVGEVGAEHRVPDAELGDQLQGSFLLEQVDEHVPP